MGKNIECVIQCCKDYANEKQKMYLKRTSIFLEKRGSTFPILYTNYNNIIELSGLSWLLDGIFKY